MTKRVQLAGGSTLVEAFLVGLDREVRVDEDNDSLRLHDGVKEGGYEFLNRDAGDQRYQFHSAELDGFVFGAQEKGFLVRTGPAQYKIRKLISSDADLEITNPRGTVSDFDLNLAAVIPTAHEWSGIQTFDERIVAVTGLTGDTYGTHHGDVIGNVTGFITGGGSGDFDGTFVGDVDVRSHTILFDDGQIPESALDPEILINRGVPIGAILMWSGSIATIPESWHLCDGTLGTPDLVSRFIVGAGDTYIPGASGGSATTGSTATTESAGDHSHTVTVGGHALTVGELPGHTHLSGVHDGGGGMFDGATTAAGTTSVGIHQDADPGTLTSTTSSTGGNGSHTHAGSTADTAGAHTHDITLGGLSVLPPYYALCYIMKIV